MQETPLETASNMNVIVHICMFLWPLPLILWRLRVKDGLMPIFSFTLFPSVPDLERMLSEVTDCMGMTNSSFLCNESDRQAEFIRVSSWLSRVLPKIPWHCYAKYCGPWVEDVWCERFGNKPISAFGVFVPLFVPWVNFWVHDRTGYFRFMDNLKQFIRPQYLYVTVSQNDDGIEGRSGKEVPDNIFIISAGGKGNVPFLLFARELRPIVSTQNIKYDVVFLGTVSTHPLRSLLRRAIAQEGDFAYFGKSSNWREIYETSKAILCPRGYGRNSFRLTETLQLGLIPIYVYDDVCWLPYYDSINWSSFSLVVRLNQTNYRQVAVQIRDFVKGMSSERRSGMQQRIRSLYDSHFTMAGAFSQVELFLTGGFRASHLRCAQRMYMH